MPTVPVGMRCSKPAVPNPQNGANVADLNVTNADLWAALVAIPPSNEGALLHLAGLELPGIASYAIKKLKRKVVEEYADLDAARVALVEKYSQKGEDGKPILTEDGKGVVLLDAKGFNEDFAEILKQPVTISGCRAITITELGDAKISANVLDALDAFIVGE